MDNLKLNFEDYAATLRTVMANAIKAAEALQTEAETDREAAFAAMDKRQDLLRQLENEAQKKAEEEMTEQYRQMKQEMLDTLAAKLKNRGMAEADISALLRTMKT